jgi:hypothetical protein
MGSNRCCCCCVITDGEISAAEWFTEMFQQSNDALPQRWYDFPDHVRCIIVLLTARCPVVLTGRHRKPRVCFKCDQGGHLARDCPTQREEDRPRTFSAFSSRPRGGRPAFRGRGGVSIVLASSK